jgi:peptide subunit release factor 1 (eRF1)
MINPDEIWTRSEEFLRVEQAQRESATRLLAAVIGRHRVRRVVLVHSQVGTEIAINSPMPYTDQLSAHLDRLAAVDPGPHPVISLYLNLEPDQHGRDRFDAFVRQAIADILHTYPLGSPEHESLSRDAQNIRNYLQGMEPSANGLALFACSGAELFEAVPLAAPIQTHRLFVSNQPHLYPLARVLDEYPRYAVLLADSHSARLFVVAVNAVERTDAIEGVKTKRHKTGGWSQARYQRHVDNFRVQHAKEVVDVLTRTVRAEQIPSVILGGDEVIVPLLKHELAKDIAERVVDVVRLDVNAPVHQILQSSLESMHQHDSHSDRERVDALLDEYRSGGLATVGVDRVKAAFEMGQVDQLVITAVPDTIDVARTPSAPETPGEPTAEERVADELIVKARQTSASIRFIEDPALLLPFGGVGAFLRFELSPIESLETP